MDYEDEDYEGEPQEMQSVTIDPPGPCTTCGKEGCTDGCFRCGQAVCMNAEDYQADTDCGGWILDWWHPSAYDYDDGNEYWCKACLEAEYGNDEE